MTRDELNAFKLLQKESWGLFAPLEVVTTMTAATLINFSRVNSNHCMLDVGCGTGVVARRGFTTITLGRSTFCA